MDCRVLGSIEVVADGVQLSIGGPKPRLLLALLLAERGRVVSVDRLVDALWGERPPSTAVPTLQTHVSRLRRLFGEGPDAPRVETRPPGYRLAVGQSSVDADRFEALVGRARAQLAVDPRGARHSADVALTEWRGPAFAEFATVEEVCPEAVRLEELRAVVTELLVDARLACGEHLDLIGPLEALLAEYPLRERLWGQLMLALYRGGRQAEALRRAQQLRRMLREEQGLDPSAAIRTLEADILTERPTLDWEPLAGGLAPEPRPPASSPLVGRTDELELARGLIARSRLVTLTGPGGVGKTRLARELVTESSARYPDGARVVELAPVRDGESTTAAVAAALDLQRRPERSLEDSIVDVLAPLGLLLVLDNCEHLLDVVAPLVDRIWRRCPSVCIVTTSREPLGLPGEVTWALPPLAVPSSRDAPLGEVGATAAVTLFVDRARAARHDFVLDPVSWRAVAEICIRLDGLPLAIELAASRVRSMTVTDVAERLDERFRLLAGTRSPDPRHRALLDVVTWSHDLLAPAERDLFARLSVFAGGFDLRRAEDVCGDDGLDRADVASLLAALVDKSMVVAGGSMTPHDSPTADSPVPGTRMRYRLLETLRDFARARLEEKPEAATATRRAHARSHLATARAAGSGLSGPDEPQWLQQIEQDIEDLREAFVNSLALGELGVALELVVSVREFAFRSIRYEHFSWAETLVGTPGVDGHPLYPVLLGIVAYGRFVRGELAAAIETGRQAIAAAERLAVPTAALAERALGNALFYQGDTSAALAWMDRMVEVARRSGDDSLLGHACYMRSVAHTCVGERAGARVLADEAQRAADRCASPTVMAQAAYAAGLACERDEPERALDLLQASVELAGSAGNRWLRAFALTEEFALRAQHGAVAAALAGYREVVDTWFRGGDWANQWLSLRHLFGVFASLGDDEMAAILHGALDTAGATTALPFEPSEAARVTALVERVRARFGSTAFDTAVARGRAMRDEEIVRLTLRHLDAEANAPAS